MKPILKLIILLSFAMCFCSLTSFSATIYAPDGRTAEVADTDVEAYVAVGWYKVPVTALYSLDGRSVIVASSEADAYKAVGWYDAVTIYAPDGRTAKVMPYEVNAYVAVGWSTESFVKLYALDGRTISVPYSQAEAYKAVGWYGSYTEVIQTLYASNGRMITVYKAEVPLYVSLGWSESVTYDFCFYSGTAVPSYTYITGVAVEDIYYGADYASFIYPDTQYGEYSELVDYISALITDNWQLVGEDVIEESFSFVWYLSKGPDMVAVMNGNGNVIILPSRS